MGRVVKYKPSSPDRKVCPVCGVEKDKEAFGKHNSRKDGLRAQCKTCRVELERPGSLKRLYGISAEDYAEMHKAQKGLCACCGQAESAMHWKGKKRVLAIDHNHTTGKVRQLICHRCNIILGLAKENPMLLDNIKNYIAKHTED